MNNLLKISFIGLFVLSRADLVVNTLTGISPNNLVYSGYLPISDTDSLFFTYYGANNVTAELSLKDYPLVVVVGSPGSSAQYLSLSSVGPMLLNSNMTLIANPNALTVAQSVMFVDLLGSGFSFAKSLASLPVDAKAIGAQLTKAINSLVAGSNLGKSKQIFIAGEGTFIRSIAGLSDIDALVGIIHLSPWPELYALGRYYGVAGMDMAIFGSSEKVAIETTFISCYKLLTA